VRSSLATGLWTPDSRICLQENASPAFKQLWQRMARQSFDTYQSYLGLPGTPVEFIDSYYVSDDAASRRREPQVDSRPAFAELQRELIGDLIPRSVDFDPGSHSLGRRYLRRNSQMMFNLSSYTRMLLADFAANGGKIEIAEFHAPDDLARLREKTLINATGYGARSRKSTMDCFTRACHSCRGAMDWCSKPSATTIITASATQRSYPTLPRPITRSTRLRRCSQGRPQYDRGARNSLNFKGLLHTESHILRTGLGSEALHRDPCIQIMHPDARQHGCDCQGVRWEKVARMEARAFKPFLACSPLNGHGSTSNDA
jgi:hypothetical protein